FLLSSGWHETSVTIRLPQTGVEHVSEDEAPEFEVTGFYHHNILNMIVSAFQNISFLDYHLKGFQEMWDPGDGHLAEQVYGEVYTSEKYLEIEDELHPEPDCDGLETVVVSCMYYSDSTHLTSFGTAALWLIYLLFGLLSKCVHAQPTSGTAHHLVYMPSLPGYIRDVYKQYFNKPASLGILTFLKQELIHAIWKKLLTAEFLKAYTYGIVILCVDNIQWYIYPRFFLYSADYPEK
ncbi:hypothetical protein ARMSODRAFT_890163, partial [Armillaria solidipes]